MKYHNDDREKSMAEPEYHKKKGVKFKHIFWFTFTLFIILLFANVYS